MRWAILVVALLLACRQEVPPQVIQDPPPVECPPLPAPSFLAPLPSPTPARGFPFRLAWGGGAPDPTLHEAAYLAADAWNQAVGREVLSWNAGEGPEVFVTLEGGKVSSAGVLAEGLVVRVAGRPRLVRLNRLMSDSLERNIITHELGHVIGIGHSENADDVMHKYAKSAFTLTPNDIRLAQEAVERGTP